MKNRYQNESEILGCIESNLTENIIECINNEIVLRSITNQKTLFQWLAGTFYYVRVHKNPRHYHIVPSPTPQSIQQTHEYIDKQLQELLVHYIRLLSENGSLPRILSIRPSSHRFPSDLLLQNRRVAHAEVLLKVPHCPRHPQHRLGDLRSGSPPPHREERGALFSHPSCLGIRGIPDQTRPESLSQLCLVQARQIPLQRQGQRDLPESRFSPHGPSFPSLSPIQSVLGGIRIEDMSMMFESDSVPFLLSLYPFRSSRPPLASAAPSSSTSPSALPFPLTSARATSSSGSSLSSARCSNAPGATAVAPFSSSYA